MGNSRLTIIIRCFACTKVHISRTNKNNIKEWSAYNSWAHSNELIYRNWRRIKQLPQHYLHYYTIAAMCISGCVRSETVRQRGRKSETNRAKQKCDFVFLRRCCCYLWLLLAVAAVAAALELLAVSLSSLFLFSCLFPLILTLTLALFDKRKYNEFLLGTFSYALLYA